MLNIAGTARFVSDLHLRAERPDIADRFAAFLADTTAKKTDALFILGDLFEYWIGDDDLAETFNAHICSLLRQTTDSGLRIFFLAGNRDFLIGDAFAQAAGMTLIDDPQKVGAGNTAILLLHGDTLCTDDLPYQQFRRLVRSSDWQRDFLARPLAERRAEVAELRRRSAEAMQGKTAAIMDANPSAVRDALIQSACRLMIHGHTHRPGHETIALDDGTAERWVLSDWETARGDALEIDAAGIRRLDWSN